MLVESIVKKVLGKYFSIFFLNFNNDDLSLKFISGEAELKNLGNYKFPTTNVIVQQNVAYYVLKKKFVLISTKINLTQFDDSN
jgi:hypothetical protein